MGHAVTFILHQDSSSVTLQLYLRRDFIPQFVLKSEVNYTQPRG